MLNYAYRRSVQMLGRRSQRTSFTDQLCVKCLILNHDALQALTRV